VTERRLCAVTEATLKAQAQVAGYTNLAITQVEVELFAAKLNDATEKMALFRPRNRSSLPRL
jgi:hypothetical protein